MSLTCYLLASAKVDCFEDVGEGAAEERSS